ncbi:MAG: hypothetical protein PHU21_14745, partial [Elusimicrobia bacterium]|nr:hypothetical protein [Elusimicrobiota bacterium]
MSVGVLTAAWLALAAGLPEARAAGTPAVAASTAAARVEVKTSAAPTIGSIYTVERMRDPF